jgi:anti-sigma regulatory factor (Ser/Thr protein kinase)
MHSLLHIEIRRDVRAPARARRAVEAFVDDLGKGTAADVKLLVSELISNSVKYGGAGAISLALRSEQRGHLHAEVVDDGGRFVPQARDRPATEAGGWGLYLVETLADRWGVRDGGARVWFEIDAGPPRGTAAVAA